MVADGSAFGSKAGGTYGWNGACGALDEDRYYDLKDGQHYATDTHVPCEGTNVPQWEVAVENGVYEVISTHSKFGAGSSRTTENRGCTVEGHLMQGGKNADQGEEFTRHLLVSDGRLTLNPLLEEGASTTRCTALSALRIRRVALDFPVTVSRSIEPLVANAVANHHAHWARAAQEPDLWSKHLQRGLECKRREMCRRRATATRNIRRRCGGHYCGCPLLPVFWYRHKRMRHKSE